MPSKGSRRAKGEGSLYQRGDGMWIGTLDLGWDAQGNRRRKSVSSRTHAECLRKLRELRKSVELGVVPTDVTVEGWMTYWLSSASCTKLRDSTQRTYRMYSERWIVPAIGRVRLDRLQPSDVERMLKRMEDEGKAASSRAQARAVLRSALKTAMREQRVARNAAQLAVPPSGEVKHYEHLELADARKVVRHLAAVGDEGDWSTCSRFLVALLAGLRQGEALGLTWEHVHETGDDPHLVVAQAVQQVKGKGLVVTGLKSKSSHRVVPLMAPAAVALEAWRHDSGGVGFVWGGSRPTAPRADWQAWREVLTAAGAPLIPLHGARSTTASLLFDAGVSDLTVSQILGHSQVQITRDRYIRATQSQHSRALGAAMKHLLGE